MSFRNDKPQRHSLISEMVGKRLDSLQGRIRNQYLMVTGTADSPDIACQAPGTWYKLARRGSGQVEAQQGFSPGASD